MRLALILLLGASYLELTFALHFYLETGQSKCFFEDLPRDTLVVGKYEAFEYNRGKDDFLRGDNLAIEITVDETFDNDHRVVQQKGPPVGEFTFTSLDSGEHRFCVIPRHVEKSWMETKQKTKILLDLAIGEATDYMDSKKKDTMARLQDKMNELATMLDEIQRHQQTIRDKESEFTKESDSVNFNVIKWTLVQIIFLVGVGYLQMRYLSHYFRKEKVV